jgi:1,4-alpha-glucan branching enzyme
MITRKQYLKSKPICKVTFRLSKTAANGARKAAIAGDFNQWKADQTPMQALKNGDFTATVTLTPGHEYQYRYLLNNDNWITDTDADKLVHCEFANCTNSVVMV